MGKEEDKAEKAKNIRREAKSTLTSQNNQVITYFNGCSTPTNKVKVAHVDLVTRHKEFTISLIDEDYDKAEIWMANCAD